MLSLEALGIDQEFYIMMVRIFLAAVLAAIVGIERETRDHPAGLRTHLLVGISSCTLMLLSIYGFQDYLKDGFQIDPSRIPAYVISGLGFLGAGTIITQGNKVKGLTTAASIWTVAAIGLVIGAGMYKLGILVTIIVFVSLYFLKKIEIKAKKQR